MIQAFQNAGGRFLSGVMLVFAFTDAIVAAPIAEVFMDVAHSHQADRSNGETWDPFWADDDNLYTFNCDGSGFGSVKRNLAFNKLTGDAPETLSGRIINTMDDYGKSHQHNPDGSTWKALGQVQARRNRICLL